MTPCAYERGGRDALADRTEVAALLDRFAAGLDEPDPARCGQTWARALFTDGVRLVLPSGAHRGLAGLPAFLNGPKQRWARTHHVVTGCRVGLDGDRATVRADVRATHVAHGGAGGFTGAGRYDTEAVRTAAGWRISSLVVTVW
ncbi:nuclear transport factor 2 family protein [Streptomyces sp. NPDC003444]